MNIVYVIESAYNSGGMERMLSIMANAMVLHHDVSVVSAFNNGREDFFPLDAAVKRYDFRIDRNSYKSGYSLKKAYKSALASYLRKKQYDVVVSLGSIEMFFLHSIKDGSKKVLWYHFAYSRFEFDAPFKNYRRLHKLIGRLQLYRFVYHAKKYDRLVCLSKSDLSVWRKYMRNVTSIYNPLTIVPRSAEYIYNSKRVIAVGRLTYQKGFDYLIDAWKMVIGKFPDWSLDIYGDGPLRDDLQKQIENGKLSNVVFLKGRCEDMVKQYMSHSLFVLSSRYEGFVLVLLEASACGLPLVSFNCEYGPSEIIENNKNGMLISPVGNIQDMAKSICTMLENEKKRETMGKQAKVMSERFSMGKILPEWLRLFEEIVNRQK